MAISSLTNPLVAVTPAAAVAAVPAFAQQGPAANANRVTPAVEAQGAGTQPDDDELNNAVRDLNSRLSAWSTNLRFELDEDTSRVVVQVVDIETGDVVRQIPSEEVLHMSKMLGKLRDLSFHVSA